MSEKENLVAGLHTGRWVNVMDERHCSVVASGKFDQGGCYKNRREGHTEGAGDQALNAASCSTDTYDSSSFVGGIAALCPDASYVVGKTAHLARPTRQKLLAGAWYSGALVEHSERNLMALGEQ